jgi:hypothetical protein
MAKFDEEKYNKMILSPAVEAFKQAGKLPDVFERYDLPLDVVNIAVIEPAIKTVVAYWNKTKNNPRFTILLSSLLNDVDSSRRILTNQELREKQREIVREDRRRRAEAGFASLDKSLELVAGKGYITSSEKKTLIERFTREGISEKDIVDRIRVPVKEIERPPKTEGLPKMVRDQIRSSLGALGKRNLYEFLGIPSPSPKEKIIESHRLREAEWRQKPAGHLKAAAQTLLGIIQTHLINGDPARYEDALVMEALEALRPEVKLAAISKRITRDVFQKLVFRAMEQGVFESRAGDYILSLAEEFGASVEWTQGEETINCAQCLTAFPRKSSLERCGVCGDPLWIKCPKCSKRIPARDQACGDCGFVVANLREVEFLIALAQKSLRDNDLTTADLKTQEALRLWPGHPELAALLAQIKSYRDEIERSHQRLSEALAGQRLFEARSVCATLISKAPDYKGHDGKDARQWRAEIERWIKEAEDRVAEARKHESGGRTEDAAVAFQEALHLAADAEEARKGLLRCPPQPPSNVRVTLGDDQILVEWLSSSSAGDIEYLVVAKRDSATVAPEDGQRLALVRDCSWRDKTQAAGAVVCYAVFAERGGARSRPSVSKPLLVAREVEEFALEVKDGIVQGSWRLSAPEGRVRIFRKEGAPPAGREGEEIKPASANHFIDRAARLGRIYYYRALVEYHDRDGMQVFTSGRVVSVRPEAPPQPLDRFEIAAERNGIRFSWQPTASGAVMIYRTDERPQWAFGEQILARHLSVFGAPLSVVGDRQALDPSPPSQSPVYYVAVTVSGDTAIVGASQSYVDIKGVSELSADDFDHYLQLKWKWPEGCRWAIVAWRPDAYPQDARDSKAEKRRITKGEYERNGGFRIENPMSRPYRFVVFAAKEVEGETIYSMGLGSGARGELRVNQRIQVEYSIRRPTLFSFSKRYKLILKASQDVPMLPDLALVARPGDLQPMSVDDAVTLATFSNRRLQAGMEKELEFSLDGVARPVYLGLFFRARSAYQQFQLIGPSPAQLKVG